MQQTLTLLTTKAYCEKQIAAELGISQHTVHVYVKQLYRKFGVSSRPELFIATMNRHAVPPVAISSHQENLWQNLHASTS
jgi:DNA-binding NarL/FixJ family response regulator